MKAKGSLTVGDVLRRNSIEEFTANRDTEISEITEQPTGGTKTLVDLETAIYIGIVDESLPADGGTRFFA